MMLVDDGKYTNKYIYNIKMIFRRFTIYPIVYKHSSIGSEKKY